MIVDYNYLMDRFYYTVTQSENFDVTDTVNRYVFRVLKQGFIPGPPLPTITLDVRQKTEQDVALGYTPIVNIQLVATVVVGLPMLNSPTALLTDLGLSEVLTQEHVSYATRLIAQTLEEWLRGDGTDDGKNRRMLYTQDAVGMEIKNARLPQTNFRQTRKDNIELSVAEVMVVLPFIRLT